MLKWRSMQPARFVVCWRSNWFVSCSMLVSFINCHHFCTWYLFYFPRVIDNQWYHVWIRIGRRRRRRSWFVGHGDGGSSSPLRTHWNLSLGMSLLSLRHIRLDWIRVQEDLLSVPTCFFFTSADSAKWYRDWCRSSSSSRWRDWIGCSSCYRGAYAFWGTYLNMMLFFGLSLTAVYEAFDSTADALLHVLPFNGFPATIEESHSLETAFRSSRIPHSPLGGCVGELGGIYVRITKPRRSECNNPAQ